MGKNIRLVNKKTLDLFQAHVWPGNIRELQNVVERAVILSSGDVLSVDELWFSKESVTTGHVLSRQTTVRMARDEAAPVRVPVVAEPVRIKTLAERTHITATLRETNWVVGGPHGAAARLGLPRTTLLARMQRLGISNGTSRGRLGQPTRRVGRLIGTSSSG